MYKRSIKQKWYYISYSWLSHFSTWVIFIRISFFFALKIEKNKCMNIFFTYSASSIHLRSSSLRQPIQKHKWKWSCQRQPNSICYYQPYHDLFIRSLKLDNILSDRRSRYLINSISFYASNDVLFQNKTKINHFFSRTCNSNKYSNGFFHVLVCSFLNLR